MSAAVHRGLSLRTGSATEYQFGRDGRDTDISSWLAPKVNNLSEETAWKWERRFFFFLGWKGARECTSACVRFSFLCRPFPHIQTSSIIHQKDLIFIPKWTLFYNVVWTREKMALWDGRSGGAEVQCVKASQKWAQGESEVPWRCPLLFFLWMWTNGDLSSQSRLLPVTSEAGAGKRRCLRYIVSQLCVTFSPLLFFFSPSSTLRWLNLLSSSYSSSVCVSPCNSPGFWLKVTPSLLHLALSASKRAVFLEGEVDWCEVLTLYWASLKKKKIISEELDWS